ncbi:hypothetical protein J6590_102067 [Homalodisca vitripennis]|nr:hypothetical protein J6590_102067 [Homalodisca vitripennis]
MIESQTKEKNKVKKQKCVPKNKMKVESESEEENDALCLICLEPFSESKPAASRLEDTTIDNYNSHSATTQAVISCSK